MSFFIKLRNIFNKDYKTHPDWSFELQNTTLIAHMGKGESRRILLDQIDKIGIETNDLGPYIEDLYWVIYVKEIKIKIPQESNIFPDLYEYFSDLDGFDEESFKESIASKENKFFLCWKKS